MFVPDDDVDDLARDTIKKFAAEAVDQAALLSNAFFVLGHTDKSKKWLLVRAEIVKMQASRTGLSS